MLSEVKQAVRIRSQALDGEINGLIDACKRDMRISGIRAPDTEAGAAVNDPLIKRAIVLYCKADFNVDDAADRYMKTYEHLKAALTLSGDYNGANVSDTGGGDPSE